MTTKRRLSASVDAELVAVAQQAVTGGHAESISAWVNDALRLKADHDRRLQALDEFLAAYEAEHGEITEDEMRDAARRARERAIVVRGNPEQRSPGPTLPGTPQWRQWHAQVAGIRGEDVVAVGRLALAEAAEIHVELVPV